MEPTPGPGGPTAPAHFPSPVVLAGALVAVSFSLRTLMGSLPPLAAAITTDLDLSNTAIGVLTTLPVLCMGGFALVAEPTARRWGPAAAVSIASLLIVCGLAIRGLPWGLVPLYAGTLIAGLGIAICGVLLPGLVKQLFRPERAGLVTAVYIFAMMTGATLSSALAVPLSEWIGSWQGSLLSWTGLALVGALAWWPAGRAVHRQHLASLPPRGRQPLPWRQGTAILLGIYLSVQSWQFYSGIAWLSPTYVEHGWDATGAGYLLAVFMGANMMSGVAAPVLVDRLTDVRPMLVTFCGIILVGELGLWLAPMSVPVLWAGLLGFGQGAAFSIPLVLIVRYAASPASAARLSGIVFAVAHTSGTLGPSVMGAIRDLTGGFETVWFLLVLFMVPQIALATRFGTHRQPVT